jgi:hypothetical protein
LRVNLGAGFNYLFTDGGNRITATFKLSKDSQLELFYKDEGEIPIILYVRGLLNT